MKIPENKGEFIGKQIKKAREEEDISQLELAKAVDFESATAISLIESGERKITAENLEKIAIALKKDIKYFLGTEDEPVTIEVALRAEKNLSKEDKDALDRKSVV